MLLPALSKAREKARNISCINNLKQIGHAGKLYVDDNDGYLADYIIFQDAGAATPKYFYSYLSQQYLGAPTTFYNDYNKKVFDCPCKAPKDTVLDYGINTAMTGYGLNPKVRRKESEIVNASAAVYFLDCTGTPSVTEISWMGFRHTDNCNIYFFDGHAGTTNKTAEKAVHAYCGQLVKGGRKDWK